MTARMAAEHVLAVEACLPLADGRVALVMPLLRGGSLAALVRARGHLGPGEVVTVLAPVAGALGRLHAAGVVHGDVSPGNVLLDLDGRPVLADLGVGRVLGEAPQAVWGTPGHLAPEVLLGASRPRPPTSTPSVPSAGSASRGRSPVLPGCGPAWPRCAAPGRGPRALVAALEAAVRPARRAARRRRARRAALRRGPGRAAAPRRRGRRGERGDLPAAGGRGPPPAGHRRRMHRGATGVGRCAPGSGRRGGPRLARRGAPGRRWRAAGRCRGRGPGALGSVVPDDPARAQARPPGAGPRRADAPRRPPTPAPAPDERRRQDPRAASERPALLLALASARARAFRGADPALLAEAETADGVLHARDAAAVGALRSSGLRYPDLRYEVGGVSLVRSAPRPAVLSARLGVARYRAVGAGADEVQAGERAGPGPRRPRPRRDGWRLAGLRVA